MLVRSALLTLAALLFTPASPGEAQTAYPTRPVRMILPFGAGGIADITSRIVADKLGEKLGQRVVIENQPGAGGVTAARSALSAPADGYMLALLANSTAISVGLFKTLPFDPLKDFAPVSSFAVFDFVFVTNAEQRYRTLADVIAAAREKPGGLNIGTINVGSSQNLAAELFKSTAGVNLTIVPYRTTPEALVGLLRNDVDVMIDTYAALRSPLGEQKIRALATSGPERSALLPQTPTVQESGVAGFEVVSWNGMFAPANVAPEIIQTLTRAVQEVVASPEIRQRFLELGIEAKGSTPEDLRAQLANDIEKWTAVIERAKIPQR